MSVSVALILTVVLLAGNAFFVGAEFAVMSVRRAQLEPLLADGARGAKTTMYAVEHVSQMLATAQLGITVCSTSLGAVAEPALAGLVEGPLVRLGLPAGTAHIFGFTAALAIVIYLHVVLGEMVPKNLAVSTPLRAALLFAPPLVWISHVLGPIVRGLDSLANLFLRAFGIEPKSEVSSTFTAEEVASIVARSQEEGLLEDEVGLLAGALEFSRYEAGHVMVPLEQVISLPQDATVVDIEDAVTRHGFSRFPVHDLAGEITGYLHVKDTLYATTDEERNAAVPSWRVRGLPHAYAGDDVEDVLAVMQNSGTHLALVTDSATEEKVGVIFLEDILEELVGEVRDSMQRRGR